ncbi:MAG TPA: acetyl-CoA acetyltransferase [Acidimicrobiales bacterium]|nr:acetyl-CoA acetyltransferase [Acidimicrobiales bacterium]
MGGNERTLRGRAAIAGVTDAVSPTGELELTGRALEAQMVRDVLDDAGLSLSDIDGVCHSGSAMQFAEFLGIHPTFTDSTNTGGSVFEVYLEHAASAVAAGVCENVLVVFAQTPRASRTAANKRGGEAPMRGRPQMPGPNPMAEWEMPYGATGPPGTYSLVASRHMAQYGTTSEQLATIAVKTREWATLNPRAYKREPITVHDVLSSDMVASPLHKLDCCLVTDGAGAFIVTSAERAKDLRKPPVYVLGAVSAHDHMMISQMPDLTVTPGAISGPKAFAMAGIKPSDVDVFMGYDSFTITQLLHFEDLGFCAKGEGGAFVESTNIGPGGVLPTNTNGGGLSYTHPGMYGMFLVVEAVRQLRGECDARQVADAEVAVAHGSGMVLSCMSTSVLGTEAAL